MAWNGNDLVTDPSTGFLVSNREDAFNPQEKLKFIELYIKGYSITTLCEKFGLSRQTYTNHLNNDQVFRSGIHEARIAHCDRLEAKVLNVGLKDQGHSDRIAYLKAYRPEVWNPKYENQNTLNIQINFASDDLAKFEDKQCILDADVVKDG